MQLEKLYASIQVNRKSFSLGLYCKIDDAIKARKDAEVKYGFHINHGNSP